MAHSTSHPAAVAAFLYFRVAEHCLVFLFTGKYKEGGGEQKTPETHKFETTTVHFKHSG